MSPRSNYHRRSLGALEGCGGELFFIKRVEFLCPRDTPQRVAPDRHQPLPIGRTGRIDKSSREQHIALDRTTHYGDAVYFVDSRANDGEVESVEAADVAVEDLTDMQTEIDLGYRQFGVGAAY